jgi:16S rRNA (cytosine1402-N4)-methyltransferase
MAQNHLKSGGASQSGSDGTYHVPVLLEEAINALAIRPEGIYVDCTFGGGGHSRAILAALGPNGRLIAFDQDADAAANLPDDPRITFVPENFRYMARFLRLYGADRVDGILADLGVSSHQFDEAERGFAYRFNASLDMRMDRRQPITAAVILNTYDAARLQQLFSAWGEVTNSRTLAAAIVARRQLGMFQTISDLLDLLSSFAKGNPNRYYAQVFQALRIAVNDEMGALHDWLSQLPQALKPGGRVAVITFHSVEDRMVKHFLKQGSIELQEDPVYGNKQDSPFRLLTKKPIEAGAAELKRNERSRSARLRIAERIEIKWSAKGL